MPPRAKSTEGSTEPPRRSTRIASQPQIAVEPAAPKAARKASSSKKRVAEEPVEDSGAEASKKVGSLFSTLPTRDVADARSNLCQAKADDAADVEMAVAEESAALAVAAALGPIAIGDTLPSLVLKNEKGEDVQIADLAKDKGVVLFLVPKADTGE